MAGVNAAGGAGATKGLTTGDVGDSFGDFIDNADKAVEDFMTDHTAGGELNLDAASSFQLQKLMSDQSVAVNTGTNVLKTVSDSIKTTARNI